MLRYIAAISVCLLSACQTAAFTRSFIRSTVSPYSLRAKLTDTDVERFEAAAVEAVKAAGKCILAGSGTINLSDDVKSKIGSRDVVTKVDLESQDIIKQTISKYLPTHKFLGEEDVEPGKDAAAKALAEKISEEHLWIIDPVDGTTNFAHGMSLCGVILAYVSKGEVLFGCIYDPFSDELFTAWKGKGAYMNGKRIHTCSTEELKSSVVCTGSPPNFASLAACLRATNLISPEVRTVRMLGSAAIMFAWVACGRLTAYFEADMNAWDIAAGALIVSEAGGRVTDVMGAEYTVELRNVVASNGKIHARLLDRLQAAEMWLKDEDARPQ